jgi:hypothetical protein
MTGTTWGTTKRQRIDAWITRIVGWLFGKVL